MTASTAPITLPAKHRTEAPIWRLHVAIARLVYALTLAVWVVRTFPLVYGREATVGVASVLVLIVAAALAVLLP